MVDWLKSKSLTRCHVYCRLETVIKTFLEKVGHKSTTYVCTTGNFNLSLWSKIKTWKFWETLLMMRKSFYFTDNQITKKWNNKTEFLLALVSVKWNNFLCPFLCNFCAFLVHFVCYVSWTICQWKMLLSSQNKVFMADPN